MCMVNILGQTIETIRKPKGCCWTQKWTSTYEEQIHELQQIAEKWIYQCSTWSTKIKHMSHITTSLTLQKVANLTNILYNTYWDLKKVI